MYNVLCLVIFFNFKVVLSGINVALQLSFVAIYARHLLTQPIYVFGSKVIF